MPFEKEFRINEHITLKLEGEKTKIYINGILFLHCNLLLLNIPIENLPSLEEVDSIDEIDERSSEFLGVNGGSELNISPEVEFWGHCSNLQVWAEQDYNTQILHSDLAFPLLKRLTEAGDLKAINIFKSEILKRFIKGSESTKEFLIEQRYLEYLTEDEFRSPLSNRELSILENLESNLQVSFTFAKNLEYITRLEGIVWKNHYYYNKLEDTHIIGLRIFKEEVKDIPEIVGDLKELKYLVMSKNYSENLPKSIGNLKKLEFLDLNTNQFEELPDSYKNLNPLKFLDLYSNNFKQIPKILENINSLEILLLGENPINNFPDKFGNLKKMKEGVYSK